MCAQGKNQSNHCLAATAIALGCLDEEHNRGVVFAQQKFHDHFSLLSWARYLQRNIGFLIVRSGSTFDGCGDQWYCH